MAWTRIGDCVCEELEPILYQAVTERCFVCLLQESVSQQPTTVATSPRELSYMEKCTVVDL